MTNPSSDPSNVDEAGRSRAAARRDALASVSPAMHPASGGFGFGFALVLTLACVSALRPVDAAPVGAESLEPVVASLRPSARVTGLELRLADVAEITGGSKGERATYADVVLGLPPVPGGSYTLSRAFVAERLVRSGLPTDRVRLAGSTSTVVRLATRTVDGERLQGEALAVLRESLDRDAETDASDLRFEIEPGPTPRALVLPAPRESLEIDYRARRTAAVSGQAWVDARIRLDGRPYPSVAVPFRVRVYGLALVAARTIERDEPIAEADVEIVEVELSPVSTRRALTEPADVRGFAARRRIAAGDVLTDRMIHRPRIVRRGDAVTLRFEDGPLRLTTAGIAEQSGHKGQEIEVRNTRSGRTVRGRILDARTVSVSPR